MGEVGTISEEELKKYNGSTPELPLLVAVKGRIFDVSSGKDFYGPGGPYAAFAGKDASRALAKMSTKVEDVNSSLDGLSEKEIGVLDNWETKFVAKYPVDNFDELMARVWSGQATRVSLESFAMHLRRRVSGSGIYTSRKVVK